MQRTDGMQKTDGMVRTDGMERAEGMLRVWMGKYLGDSGAIFACIMSVLTVMGGVAVAILAPAASPTLGILSSCLISAGFTGTVNTSISIAMKDRFSAEIFMKDVLISAGSAMFVAGAGMAASKAVAVYVVNVSQFGLKAAAAAASALAQASASAVAGVSQDLIESVEVDGVKVVAKGAWASATGAFQGARYIKAVLSTC